MLGSRLKFAAFALPLLAGLAGCDTQGPAGTRGAAYPEAVGYDSPDQVPPLPAPPPPQYAQQPPQYAGQAQAPTEMPIGADSDNYADTDPSALTDFRSALDPYGSWADDPNYGTVWVPSESVVGSDFSPYVTGGHWGYGDDYVWMSDYDWGWAPFHYGRWAYMGGRGWGWVPGREYAGAWVSWRAGSEGYVGWGALPPTYGWRGGNAVGIGAVAPAAYNFTHTSDLFAPSVGEHVLAGPQVAAIAAHTQPYVAATPGVLTAAHPGVNSGPPPSTMLHIPDSQIAHLPANDRGLMKAQQFAHPASAQLAGARAPATGLGGRYVASGTGARTFAGGAVAGHALLPRPTGMMPAYGNYASRMGTTRIGGSPYGNSYGSHPAYSYGGSRGGQAYYGSGSTYHGGSSVRAGGSAPATTYTGGSGGFTGGGGHSSGGHGGGGHGGGGHR